MGWDPFGSKASKDIKKAAAQAAEAAREAAAAQAEAFKFNAGIYARNADVVEQQALVDEARQRRAGGAFEGQQNAAIAGSGFQNTGFEDIKAQTDQELDLDAIIIRRQGQFKAADYIAQETLAFMNADTAIKAGEAQAQAAILEGNIRANAAQNSAISGTISQGIGVASIAFSDARVKEHVKREGTAPNGLGVYSFNYVWDAPEVRRVGFMAQEARESFPDAVAASPEGILTIDYGKIGLPHGYALTEVLKPGRRRSRMGGVF